MNFRTKDKYKKNALIVCLLWLASVFVSGSFANAQTENLVSAPVEILMAEPEIASSSISASFFNQAKKYHDGDGVAQDFSRAHTLYLKAAGMGNNNARINLGYLYFMGEGVEQSYTKARNWYLSAANNGSRDAQLNLAMIYQNGFGVAKDNKKAQYWRTYEQVQAAKKKLAIAAAAKKSAKAKQVSMRQTVSKSVTRTAALVVSKKLQLTTESVIGRKVGINTIQILANQQPTITAPAANMVAPNTVIPKAQQLTQQVFVGNAVNSGVAPIFASEQVTLFPKTGQTPTRSLKKAPGLNDTEPYILPQWVSNSMGAILLALVMITSVWFFSQYTTIAKQKKARVFAKAFYAHHRDQLRVNYLRYPLKHRKIDTMNDMWAVALCVLMVRFAQSQQDENNLVGMQSNKILQALKDSPFKAKQAVFPFVKVTQHRIFDDIQALDCNFKEAPRKCEEPPRVKVKPLAPVIKIKDVLTMESAKKPSLIAAPKDVLKSDYAQLVKRQFIGTEIQKIYS